MREGVTWGPHDVATQSCSLWEGQFRAAGQAPPAVWGLRACGWHLALLMSRDCSGVASVSSLTASRNLV